MLAVKPFLSPLLLAGLVCLMLSACSSGPGEEEFAPQILAVNSNVIHRHPSFYEKRPSNPQRSIDFTFWINFFDPQGVKDISSVYVINLNNNERWTLFDPKEVNAFSRCVNGDVFECPFFSENHPDDIDLNNYEMVIQDRSGNTRKKSFTFTLAGGEQPDPESFVYSEQFTGDTNNGYQALDVMTIADNALVFNATADTQSFHIEFVVSDPRAKEYALDFYNIDTPPKLVGSVKYDSGSIQSNSIPDTLGQATTLDLPWSEIEFEEGFSVADIDDIKYLHITLFDNPIPRFINNNEDGVWFNHLAISEAIPLPE